MSSPCRGGRSLLWARRNYLQLFLETSFPSFNTTHITKNAVRQGPEERRVLLVRTIPHLLSQMKRRGGEAGLGSKRWNGGRM